MVQTLRGRGMMDYRKMNEVQLTRDTSRVRVVQRWQKRRGSKECWLCLKFTWCTLIAIIIEMHRKWNCSWTGGTGTHFGKHAAKWFWLVVVYVIRLTHWLTHWSCISVTRSASDVMTEDLGLQSFPKWGIEDYQFVFSVAFPRPATT